MWGGDPPPLPPTATSQAADCHTVALAQEKGMGAELLTPSSISRVPYDLTYSTVP
jgi:hypothetical protein